MSKLDHLGLDGNSLRTFLTVLDETSVSRAAEMLGVSQSAVSHTLDKLREIFEDPLFVRVGRGIKPTARARALRSSVESVLAELKSLTEHQEFDPLLEQMEFTIAANDFSIFQRMLEDFLSDSAFFANNPNDISLNLMCTSMGNQLLKRYLIKREKQGIDLVPVYDKTSFIGSDAGYDSFEEGKGFHNLTQMSDSVFVYVNRKDWPLTMSQYMNMKLRMGRAGVTNLNELPGSVLVLDLTDVISWEDLPALGHDYLLRNKEIQSKSIESSLKEE